VRVVEPELLEPDQRLELDQAPIADVGPAEIEAGQARGLADVPQPGIDDPITRQPQIGEPAQPGEMDQPRDRGPPARLGESRRGRLVLRADNGQSAGLAGAAECSGEAVDHGAFPMRRLRGLLPFLSDLRLGDRGGARAADCTRRTATSQSPGHRGLGLPALPPPFHETCCFPDEAARCTIYASRPAVCGALAAGGPQCQDARARAGLPPLDPVAVEGAHPGSGA
jgi:hypothetical protein